MIYFAADNGYALGSHRRQVSIPRSGHKFLPNLLLLSAR